MIKSILGSCNNVPVRLVEHSHQYQLLEDRATSIQAWLLLAIYLDKHQFNTNDLMENIVFSENGKPYFTKCQPQLFFNISRTSNNVILAISSSCEIGVDIEKVHPIDFDSQNMYFTAKEVAYISQSHDKNLAFFTLWTKKEAFLKCIGAGLGIIELNDIEVLNGSINYLQQDYHFYPLALKEDLVGYICVKPRESIFEP